MIYLALVPALANQVRGSVSPWNVAVFGIAITFLTQDTGNSGFEISLNHCWIPSFPHPMRCKVADLAEGMIRTLCKITHFRQKL